MPEIEIHLVFIYSIFITKIISFISYIDVE
jgi:hypothetical protein